MDIFHCTEHLVEKELEMLLCEVIIGLDNLVEVSVHELKDNKYIFEVPPRWRQHYVLDLDDVGMPEKPEKLDFAEDPSGVGNMLEDVGYLLYRHLVAGLPVDG